MSVKDVNKVYKQICDQYREMLENLKELGEEASNDMIDPDRIAAMEAMIAPLKDNYQRWSYMMFLLNEPTRKDKKAKYRRQNEKLIKSLDQKHSIKNTLDQNSSILTNMKDA